MKKEGLATLCLLAVLAFYARGMLDAVQSTKTTIGLFEAGLPVLVISLFLLLMLRIIFG